MGLLWKPWSVRLLLCAFLVTSVTLVAWAGRVASAGSPNYTVDAPDGWKHQVKQIETNQRILLQAPDGSRVMMVIAVPVRGGDKTKIMAQMLTELSGIVKNPQVVQKPHSQTFGSHQGVEMVVKGQLEGGTAHEWCASFFIGEVLFGSAGISQPSDTAAVGTFREIAGTVSTGGGVATQPETPTPNPTPQSTSRPRLRDRLKSAFTKILSKLPPFKPKE